MQHMHECTAQPYAPPPPPLPHVRYPISRLWCAQAGHERGTMGIAASALHQAATQGDISALRIAIQNSPQQIDEQESTVRALRAKHPW